MNKKVLFSMMSLLLLNMFSGCGMNEFEDTKNDKNDIEEEAGIEYEFSYSILVSDDEGENLLSSSYKSSDCYSKENVFFRFEDRDDPVIFDVENNDSGELQLNVRVIGKFREDTPVQKLIVQWGATLYATFDTIKLELEKVGDVVECKKIWFNQSQMWDYNDSNDPIFSVVKEKRKKASVYAEAITLNLPEKVMSDNLFALNLFEKACVATPKDGNVFISPFSVNIALNTLLNGAAGETRQQILCALEMDNYTLEQINEYSRLLCDGLTLVDPTSVFSYANSIWYAPNFEMKKDFMKTNEVYYNAGVNALDFSSEEALSTINQWCAHKTNNKISQIINNLDANTLMVLVNALYFRGYWNELSKFDKKLTCKADFYGLNGTKKVDMMYNQSTHSYRSNEYAKYVYLSFGNEAFRSVFILPNEHRTMEEVVEHLKKDNSWTMGVKQMSARKVNLSLPKFKVTGSYDMENLLLQMGLSLPFSAKADFSGISHSNLFINRILHEATIEINEDGAEAAAITLEEWALDGLDEVVSFTANRPFLFSIFEESTGLILFMGKVSDIN